MTGFRVYLDTSVIITLGSRAQCTDDLSSSIVALGLSIFKPYSEGISMSRLSHLQAAGAEATIVQQRVYRGWPEKVFECELRNIRVTPD